MMMAPGMAEALYGQVASRLWRIGADAGAWAALAAYGVLAAVCTWPLPLALSTRVTGPVGGDTGVYIWNIWLFRHEIVAHARFPYFTSEILSLTPPVDLSLHNYTTFTNLLAFPLIPIFGVTATFNLIYLTMIVLTGWAMFLLARSLTGRAIEAWLAGALFAASPVLMTRGMGHFSLVAAVPLPVFAWCVIRAERTLEKRYAAAAGLTIAWATLCDAYYGIFCLILGTIYVAARWIRVRVVKGRLFAEPPTIRVLDGFALALAGVIVGIAITGGTTVRVGGVAIAMRSLYNPVMALTLLLAIRIVLTLQPRVSLPHRPRPATVAGRVTLAALACVLPLSPVLYALANRLSDGGTLHAPIFWRSSPRGVDLLALIAPNPNHALMFRTPVREWLSGLPQGFIENVASLPLVALAVIVWAAWRYRFRAPAEWIAVCIVTGALALGPFVHVGGVNTYVPGPWALLRYLPLVGAARMPARFTIVLMLGLSVVFAMALAHLTASRPARRRLVLSVVAALLLVELVPAPRTLYSAEIPEVFRIIKNDPRDVRVLNLPYGIRDGESSLGNFTAATQFYQTFHEKRLIGGYLSRISQREKKRQRRFLMIRSLIRRSEGRPKAIVNPRIQRARGRAFIHRARVGYVVLDSARATPDLRAYAIHAFDLEWIATSDGYELYRPRSMTR